MTLFVLLLSSSFVYRATPAAAIDTWQTHISTGAMLGSGYDPRSFYVRQNGGSWQPTYAGTALAGRLMNFRAANALFDDEKRSDDNPDANTDAFISNFDAYKAHGILAMTVSLQGGNPGYKTGELVSAFNPDGSLKPAWMERASRVIEAADQRGMVIILSYFYVRQDQILVDSSALKQAITNATDWLIANDYRNVIIEIANEYNLGFKARPDASLWQHELLYNNAITNGIGESILLAKSRYDGKGYRVPVAASSSGILWSGAVADTSDLALIHGNGIHDTNTQYDDTYYLTKTRVVDKYPYPVIMNEDNNGLIPGQDLLERDTHAMDDMIRVGGSWGMMWKPYNMTYPFRWHLGDASQVTTESGYFHAILDVYQQRLGSQDSTPPAAPTGLTASVNAAGNAIVLDWANNSESDLSGYHVYRSANSGGPFIRVTSALVTTSDFTDSSAPQGTSYYRVTAVDTATNESPPSNTATATRPGSDATPPTAPTGLTAGVSANGSTVNLDWADNTEADLAGYHVYRSSDGTTFTKLTTTLVTGSAYGDTTAPTGVTLTYRVTAVDTSGNESGPSNTATATRPQSGYSLLMSTAANRSNPVALNGQTVAGNIYVFTSPDTADIKQVRFWLDNPNMTGSPYQIENGAPYDFRGGTPSAANPFDTTKIADGAHTITATISFTNGTSQIVSASFTVNNGGGSTPGDTIAPAAPTNLTTQLSTDGSPVGLEWADNVEPDLAGYHVYRSSTSSGPYTRLTNTPISSSSFSDTTAPAGTTFYYRVTAMDTSGNESSPSNTTSATRPQSSYGLVVSTSSNRPNPVALNGRTVAGNIYVFTSPDTANIMRVRFWLDNPNMTGTPRRTEGGAPYDFAGGTVSTANPFNTGTIANGAHTITAAIDLANGTTELVSATFTVSN